MNINSPATPSPTTLSPTTLSSTTLAPDPRVRVPVLPTRILMQEGPIENAGVLLTNAMGQALVSPGEVCTLRQGASLLLDFGRELHGGLRLTTSQLEPLAPAKLRLRFGESASEAMATPNNEHAVHDMEIDLPPMGAAEFGLTGFRFARIDVLSDATIQLMSAHAMTLMRPLQTVGAFECSDERLNQIWQTGADTVHLCLQDFVWDGPKRDRLVWCGDLHPEVAVVNAVWGELDIVPQSLDWARDSTPLPGWMNGISSYSMWWTIIHRDWFLHHGNRQYLEEQRVYLSNLLPLLLAFGEDEITCGGDNPNASWKFLDWPTQGNDAAVNIGIHALLTMTLEAAAFICDQLNETKLADSSRDLSSRLHAAAPPAIESSKQASALLVLAGLQDATTVNQTVLARDPLRGISTFYGYYVLQARAEAGDYAGAIEVIRQYWGGMLDLGATSFWEHFELEWKQNAGRIDELPNPETIDVHATYGEHCYIGHRHSLCHGWAAGPTAWLSEHVLGIRPLTPGCTRVSIAPQLADLQWARGAFPTPFGPIRVLHERRDGKIHTEIEAPEGVEIVRE